MSPRQRLARDPDAREQRPKHTTVPRICEFCKTEFRVDGRQRLSVDGVPEGADRIGERRLHDARLRDATGRQRDRDETTDRAAASGPHGDVTVALKPVTRWLIAVYLVLFGLAAGWCLHLECSRWLWK